METKTVSIARPQLSLPFMKTYRGSRCASLVGAKDAEDLLESTRQTVVARIPMMFAEQRYKARDFFEVKHWNALNLRRRIASGICLAHLTDQGLVRLRQHRTKSGKGSKVYFKAVD